jgi:6-phosphogluconolactonase
LSGGNTPKHFFDALSHIEFCRHQTPWRQIQFFFGDERYVAADDPASNYHMAYEHLFAKVPVRTDYIYPIPTDIQDPKIAAQKYAEMIKNVCFDLLYLGLGDDAHTASLMPQSTALNASPDQTVVALWVEKLNMYRITLTPIALNNSHDIIFLVTGTNKAAAVQAVLEGVQNPEQYPAQLIHCKYGKNIWYLDQAAAAELS